MTGESAQYIRGKTVQEQMFQIVRKLDTVPDDIEGEIQDLQDQIDDIGLQSITPIIDGTYAAGRAVADESGNNIETTYATKADISAVYKVKGSKATVGDLPQSDNVVGDVWNVLADGSNYVWTGSEWDKLSETVDLSAYATKAEITGGTLVAANATNAVNAANAQYLGSSSNTVGSDTKPIKIVDGQAIAVGYDVINTEGGQSINGNLSITGTFASTGIDLSQYTTIRRQIGGDNSNILLAVQNPASNFSARLVLAITNTNQASLVVQKLNAQGVWVGEQSIILF